jgi:DNA-binding CsgD family transcriptional regulator
MAYSTTTRAKATIERLAQASVSGIEFQWSAVDQLRRIVGFGMMCWTSVDPATWLPSWSISDNPVVGRHQRSLHQSWPTARDLTALTERGFTATSASTGGDLGRDRYWAEIAGPAGLGDSLSVALTADGACWGMLHLYRERSDQHFTAEDAFAVRQTVPVLARRLRRAALEPAGGPPSGDELGTIVVDHDHGLVASTPAADRWLSRLPQPVPGGDSLPGFLYALVKRATSGDLQRATPDRCSPRLRIRAADGTWLLLRAASLSESPALGRGAVAVTIEPARPVDLQHVIMRAHRLSDREREVAALVVNGLTNPDIAEALFITRYTVADHLKAIYGKVGVSSRSALALALSGTAGNPAGPSRPR